MAYNGEIHRRERADDQFDVVSLKNFVIELLTWKDVTASVASTMREIWVSESQKEWKDKVVVELFIRYTTRL